jgi:hypothetical protein
MTEIRRPPALLALGPVPSSNAKKNDIPVAAQGLTDSYKAQKLSQASRPTSIATLGQGVITKDLERPSVRAKSEIASDNLNFVANFFQNGYKAPGYTKTLASLRDKVFSKGFPFLFVVKEGKDEKTGQNKVDALPCSPFYDEINKNDRRNADRDALVYLSKKGSKETFFIGSINDVESEQTPLGYHLLMLNNEHFEIDDPDNVYGGSIAASSILFELGVCVPQDKVLAAGLMTHLSKDEQRFYVGQVMIDALLEEDYHCAEACLKHGGESQSVDDHGHLALSCALRPAARDFLQKMLDETGTSEDIPILKSVLKNSSLALDPAIRKILTEAIIRISQPNL